MNYLLPIIQIEDSNGNPLAGGKIYVYDHGTENLAITYKDFDGILNTNPVILDSLGHADIIVPEETMYDVIVKDSNDELMFTLYSVKTFGSEPIPVEQLTTQVEAGEGIHVQMISMLDNTYKFIVSLSTETLERLTSLENNTETNKENIDELDTRLSTAEQNIIVNNNRITNLENNPYIDASQINTGILPASHGGTGVDSIENIRAGKDIEGNSIIEDYAKKSYVLGQLAEKIVNETLDASDEERAYTGKMIADYISDALSGNVGSWRGNLTVAQVNAIADGDLKPGDSATITDSGTIRLGDFTVVAGDEIYYVANMGQWQKKVATYVRPTDYANSNRGGTIKTGTNDGELQVNANGVASLIGYNKHITYEYNPSEIGDDSPAADCKTYWYSIPDGIRMVYNNRGKEHTIIFSKKGNYGNIITWSYKDKYIRILRKEGTSGNDGWKSTDWETIDAGNADTATTANKVGHSLSLGGKTFNGSADVSVSFRDIMPTNANYDFQITNQCVHMFTTPTITSGTRGKFGTFMYTFRDSGNTPRYGIVNLYWDSVGEMRLSDYVYGGSDSSSGAIFYIRKNSNNTYNIYCKTSNSYAYLSYALVSCAWAADIHNSVTTDTANLVPETIVSDSDLWGGYKLSVGTISPEFQTISFI